jgi:hypothetical protein
MEGAINFHGVELRGVVGQVIAFGQTFRVESAGPASSRECGSTDVERGQRAILSRRWYTLRMPKEFAKKRFSIGRRVLVGIGVRPATVQSVAGAPSILGEYEHEVLVDGKQQIERVLGCDLQPIPELDSDLQSTSNPTIHIQNSNVANLNLGSQVGMINAALQSISGGNTQQREFARAVEQLTQAVLSEATLQAADKQEVVDVLSTVAEQAAKKPEERSKGTLKAAVAWLPTAISAAKNLKDLWDTLCPIIKTHLGV